MYKKTLLSLAIASSIALTGCLEDGDNKANANPDYRITNPQSDPLIGRTQAVFDPIAKLFPVPNDLMFDSDNTVTGTTKDGTLVASSQLAALDYLDGASTVSPIDIPFSGELNNASTNLDARAFIPNPDGSGVLIPNPNQNVFLLDLTYPGGDELSYTSINDTSVEIPTFNAGILYTTYTKTLQAVGGNTSHAAVKAAEAALLRNVDYRAEVVRLNNEESVLRIIPRSPLNPESKYLVVVTTEVQDKAGLGVIPSTVYQNLRDSNQPLANSVLAPVRAAIQGWEKLAEGWFKAMTNKTRPVVSKSSLTADNIALSLTFTTAGTTTVLTSVTAPETFIIKDATIKARQAGITSLVSGKVALASSEITGGQIASGNLCLNTVLLGAVTTSSSTAYISKLDPTSADYDASIKYFSQLTDSTDQFKAQAAAAEGQALIADKKVPTSAQTSAVCGSAVGSGGALATAAVTKVSALVKAGAIRKPASGLTALDADKDGKVELNEIFIPIDQANVDKQGTVQGAYMLSTKVAAQASGALDPAKVAPGYLMQGQINMPYYLPQITESTKSGLLTGTWKTSDDLKKAGMAAPTDKITYRYPFPQYQGEERVPFLLSVPDAATVSAVGKTPSNGKWPVIIFQHGIFGARSHSLPLGNALGAACLSPGSTAACFATIAIDQPLHGIAPKLATGSADPFVSFSVDVDASKGFAARDWTGTPYEGLHERHYGYRKTPGDSAQTPTAMVYNSDATAAAGYSGEYYINLTLPPASRDNLKESALDLTTLLASLKDVDIDGDGVGDLDTSKVYFVGHSFGGIVGTTFAATATDASVRAFNPELPKINAVALEMTGGQITRILENSPSLGGAVLGGLSAASGGVLSQGASSFETWMNISQGAIESGDSINFAYKLGTSGTPIIATEIYGDGTTRSTQDQTIPIDYDKADGDYFFNAASSAQSAPLAGTEPLIKELGLISLPPKSTPHTGNGSPLKGVVRFNTGEHTSIVTTLDNSTAKTGAKVITEVATQLASFFTSDGTAVYVGAGDSDDDKVPDTASAISTATPDITP
ncbi:MAG: hypothetical protein H7A00_03000 [Hahellaceae bacterium]|nr:hypothetical protein [Hahellaceae bacterium]